jgi:hypothetical protein
MSEENFSEIAPFFANLGASFLLDVGFVAPALFVAIRLGWFAMRRKRASRCCMQREATVGRAAARPTL